MPKIAIVGAGGYVFPLTLIRDILSFPALRGSTFALTDIDPAGLARTAEYAKRLIRAHELPAEVEASTDRTRALNGADFVIVTFQVGGLEAYRIDVEIPRRYGVDQTVGDTLGPGGVFRGLRTMAVLSGLAEDMHRLCPAALLIQYANPMSINCWFTAELGIRTVGLCHSVQGTSRMLAEKILGYAPGTWSFRCAGINHQSWFIEFSHEGKDALQELRDRVDEYSRGAGTNENDSDDLYGGGRERVRAAIMKLTGFFQTESSHHASEYLPYFRKSASDIDHWLPERWDYYAICRGHSMEAEKERLERMAVEPLTASEEYGAYIIDSMVTGTPRVIYGNVTNNGLITNLPLNCCVEVPCLVDKQGIQPTVVGSLPAACAAINWGSIAVQNCTVRAAQAGDRELVHAAVALDKLTSAIIGLDDCRQMVDEMFFAERHWLPQFQPQEGFPVRIAKDLS